jgi:polygalacturonase
MKCAVVALLAVGTLFHADAAFYSTPTLPRINTNNIIVVTNAPYFAKGDNQTDNTLAISNAIVAAAAGGLTNGAAGGTVEIPAGTDAYLCGPLRMKSSVNLRVDAGAILRMLPYGTYPGNTSFIGATNLNDVEISGSGAIDGQGADWWTAFATNSSLSRPIMVRLQGCSRQLIQDITLSNSPMFHISISGNKGNATVLRVTVQSPPSSANPPAKNTDACDVSGTNVLVQDCHISVGDDDFTCSGGTSGVLLTNNTYGTGHGISIGSDTSGGVSNILVINCTIDGADNGIRIKSDNDRGGLVRNISYYNIGITNVHFPIQIYSYYNWYGTPSSITPAIAASTNAATVTIKTPIYRDITFSNINASSVSGYPVGIIWSRTEMPATNIVFNRVNVRGDRNFCLYNVSGAQFIDCGIQVSSSYSDFTLFNAQVVVTNTAPANTLFSFDGLTTNGYGNSFSLYNINGTLKNTNALDNGPLTLGAGTFTVSNNLTLFPNDLIHFFLGTNGATLAVAGNLSLGGTNDITAGPGFTNGTYTLMRYSGTLNGALPALGAVPSGYQYSFNTNTAGLVALVVQTTNLPPAAPAKLTATATNLAVDLSWNAVGGATNYNLKRGTVSGVYSTVVSGLTRTNYVDTNVTNAVTYYYVVTAAGAGGESTNSAEASTAPLPSIQPASLAAQVAGGRLWLSWPKDHLGWRLEVQTNDLAAGLGTNWVTVPATTNSTSASVAINTTNGSVFLRLVYP